MLGLSSPPRVTPQRQPQPLVKPLVKPQVRPPAKKHQKKEGKASRKPRVQTETQVWVKGLSDDGHTYYYNTVTGGEET